MRLISLTIIYILLNTQTIFAATKHFSEINQSNVVFEGYIVNDLTKVKKSCPIAFDAPFICRVLYFINPKETISAHQLYSINFKQITNDQVAFSLSINDKNKNHTFLFNMMIHQIDSANFLAFLNQSKSILLSDKEFGDFLINSYFSDVKLTGDLILPINRNLLYNNKLIAEKIINLLLDQSSTLYLSNIKTLDKKDQKQIIFNFNLANLINGDGELSLYIPHLVYALPILGSLKMTNISDIEFENQVYFDYLSVNMNQFYLLDDLPIAKSLILSPMQNKVESLINHEHQLHQQDFLNALALFLSDPVSFETFISAKYSFHHTDDFLALLYTTNLKLL